MILSKRFSVWFPNCQSPAVRLTSTALEFVALMMKKRLAPAAKKGPGENLVIGDGDAEAELEVKGKIAATSTLEEALGSGESTFRWSEKKTFTKTNCKKQKIASESKSFKCLFKMTQKLLNKFNVLSAFHQNNIISVLA